jgi:hypothetical protein
MRFRPGFRYGASTAVMGALALLAGETDGFAIDATSYDGVTAAAYTGGPVGGTVAVINTGDPTDDLSNVALDSSNLVQSGTSPKMVHHLSSPYVRWSPHNYVLQSQTAGTTWTAQDTTVTDNDATAPDGTTTADALTHTNPTAYIQQNLGSQTGVVYTLSWYVKASGATWVRLMLTDFAANDFAVWFDVVNGTVGGNAVVGAGVVVSSAITSVGSDWYLCRITGHLGGSTGQFRPLIGFVTADSGAAAFTASKGGWIWGAQVNRGYTALPYLVTTTAARIGIPQSYDAAASKYGILVEPAVTNVVLRSDDLATTWTAENVTVTKNATGPDAGSNSATTFTPGTGNTNHDCYQDFTVTSATWVYSAYFKNNGYGYAGITHVGTGRYAVLFDLSDGSVVSTDGSGTNTSSGSVSIGNGWYRCWVAADTGGTSGQAALYSNNDNTPTWNGFSIPTFAGDGSSGVLVCGVQAEPGSIPSSLIPTLGSTVTRAVDVVSALIASIPYSTTKGTMYLDFKNQVTGGTQVLAKFQDPVADQWYLDDNTANYRAVADDNGAFDVVGIIAAATRDTRHQITFAGAANDWDWSIDGGAVSGDTSGGFPAGVTTANFGGGTSGGNPANMLLYRFIYVPRQVETEDGDLEAWRYTA